MLRNVVLSLALTASLVGSYLSFTSEETAVGDSSVVVVAGSSSDLASLSWSSDKLQVSATRKKDAAGEYTWFEVVEKKTKKAPPPPPVEEGAEPPPPPPEEVEEVRTVFLGNEKTEELWTSFSPLQGLRRLELGADFDRSVLALDPPAATLTVGRGSSPVALLIGGETYGSKDRYVKRGDELFLVDDAVLKPLEFASSRLLERRLVTQAEDTAEQVVLEQNGQRQVWTQVNRDDRAKAFWAREGSTEADEAAALWMGKLLRLRLASYEEESAAPPLRPLYRYEVQGAGARWSVEILQAEDGEYFAKSNFNRGLVKLTRSLASEASDDVAELLGG